jgi:hypothetical protein
MVYWETRVLVRMRFHRPDSSGRGSTKGPYKAGPRSQDMYSMKAARWVGGVVLFVEDGLLSMLEVHWDDRPIPLPQVNDVEWQI